MSGPLLTIGLLASGVALGLFMARRARLLAIPSLLIIGLALGNGGLGVLGDDALVGHASELGLVLMLFFTSLFSNPRALKNGAGVGVPLAAYDLVLNFGVAWWIGTWFGWGLQEKLFLMGILATSSTAVVMKVLGDENRITRREGNVLVSLLLVEDWVFLGFFAFLGFRFGTGASHGPLDVAIGIAAFGSFLLVVRVLRDRIWDIRSKEVLVAVLVSIAVLGAYLGSLASLPSVGCSFTTGLVLAGDRAARFAQQEASYLREGSSALFFLGYGALIGPTIVPTLIPLVGLSLVGIIVTELLFVPVLARRLGLSPIESIVTGSLLVPRGGKSAAFGRLYTGDSAPLFGLAGILAVLLTPLAPVLVKVALAWERRRPVRFSTRAGDSFSRAARQLLMPFAFRQRWNASHWEWIVLSELALLTTLLGVVAVVVPWPLRAVPVVIAVALLPWLLSMLRRIVRRAPARRDFAQPWNLRRGVDSAWVHLPWLLAGPVALLLVLAVGSRWAIVVYPTLFALFFMLALVVPWLKERSRAPIRAGPVGA